MTREQALDVARTHLTGQGIAVQQWVGHYYIHCPTNNDTTCPFCREAVSKAFEAGSNSGVMAVACHKCAHYSCWLK